MPRTTIDFHQTGKDAAAALSSLQEVGLNPGDVGGAWLAEPGAEDARTDAATTRRIAVTEVGEVCFSGWLVERALEALGDRDSASLAIIFDGLTGDGADLARLRDTLAAGGGLVGVRARDPFSPEPD